MKTLVSSGKGLVMVLALMAAVETISAPAQAANHGCRSDCQARVNKKACNAALDQKKMKGPVRAAEFDKCVADPESYGATKS